MPKTEPKSDPADIKRRLYDLGHFHNPRRRVDVTEADLDKLGLHDVAVMDAIASFQGFMAPDLERLSMKHHDGRRGDPDGEIGPATEELFEMPRCGFPDYPVPGSALASRQEANWPDACRRKLKFGRTFKNLPGLSQAETDEIFWAFANNITYAIEDIEIEVAEYGDTDGLHIIADKKRLGGSTLAWSYLARNTCNTRLQQAYDSDRNWNRPLSATVSTHEGLHAMGCPHVRDPDATMYPSIHQRSLARYGYLNDTDLSTMRGLGYKPSGKPQPPMEDLFRPRPHGPTDPPKPDPPGPGPDPDPPEKERIWHRGSITVMENDNELYDVILVKRKKA